MSEQVRRELAAILTLMTQAQFWSSVIAATFGIVGLLMGQWVSSRRDDRRWYREQERDQKRWTQERELTESRWDRERELQMTRLKREAQMEWRTHRIEYYTAFIDAIAAFTGFYEKSIMPGYNPDAAITIEQYEALRSAEATIEIAGSNDARDIARKIVQDTFSMKFIPVLLAITTEEQEADDYRNQYITRISEIRDLRRRFVEAIRLELATD